MLLFSMVLSFCWHWMALYHKLVDASTLLAAVPTYSRGLLLLNLLRQLVQSAVAMSQLVRHLSLDLRHGRTDVLNCN